MLRLSTNCHFVQAVVNRAVGHGDGTSCRQTIFETLILGKQSRDN